MDQKITIRFETHAEAMKEWNRLYRERGILAGLKDTYSDVNYAGGPRMEGTKPFVLTYTQPKSVAGAESPIPAPTTR